VNDQRAISKNFTCSRLAFAAILIAFMCQLPALSAQVTNPAALPSNHNDLFTKPAAAKPVATKPSATDHAPINSAADFSSAPPVEQQLHLIVGRSTFVNTAHRLTRVYVTSPSVLDTYTASPNQIVVTAKKPGTSSLIVWDEAGESQAFMVTSDLNVDVLRNAIKQALPNDNVTVSGSEGRVVLTGTIGTDKVSDQALKMASQYSKDVTNALVVNPATIKQVRLKVRIVEVDRSKLNAFAFNFFNTSGKLLAGTTTGQVASSLSVTNTSGTSSVSVSNPLNFLLYSSRLNIGVTLQDLETLNVLQILSEPEITAMSGEKGSFLAGGEFPFPVVQGGAGGLTSITIQFRPYGVKLEFTPTVNTDGTIQLKVAPEVSSLDFTNAVQISGYTIPALQTRRADTQVVLRSGETFAISGLLDKRATDQFSSTPGIANIPILGALFKSKNVNHSAQELVVIVTPTIVDPLTDTAFPQEPKLPVTMLDSTKFDKIVPEIKGKK
jgi:pilus assembly protein CpaC